MNSLEWTLAWCVVQVGIVAIAGVAMAWAAGRRSPAGAAMASAVAVATVGMVTLLAPVRLPLVTVRTHDGVVGKPRAAGAMDRVVTSTGEGDVAALSLSSLLGAAVHWMQSAGSRVRPVGTMAATLTVIVLAGATAGLLRFLAALRYVADLRRNGSPVQCEATKRQFIELAQSLGIDRDVCLYESGAVGSPAAVGWRRPVVLLPTRRLDWTPSQLRAALAHELAHVARGDFFWRLAASLTQAIHFYHPLVHWLVRRMALAQELAADSLAAAASGGRASYVRALSELAIRIDDGSRLRAEPLVVPAFSSNLIRRITMLRSKDGNLWNSERRLAGVLAAGVLVAAGVGTTVLRSSAEAVAETAAATETSVAMFQRAPIDPAIMRGTPGGLFVVRLGELSERAAFAPAIESLDKSCKEHWREMFGAPSPSISFEAVEYVAGAPQLTIGPLEKKDEAHPEATGRLMLGCGGAVIRFKHDVDWRAWLREFMPMAQDKTIEGFAYVELPPMKALGPVPLTAAASDGRTLVVTGGVDLLRKLFQESDERTPPVSDAEWRALDGGLVTMIATDAHIDRSMPTPVAPAAQVILREFQRAGVGLDLDEASNAAGVRVDLACADPAAAARVEDALAELLPLAKTTIAAELEHPTDDVMDASDRAIAAFWLQAIDACTVRVESNDDGTARVRLAATTPFPPPAEGTTLTAEKSSAESSPR